MTWVRLDDRFPRHRKLRRIPPAAGWLHVCALCWSSENLTNGIIPAAEVCDLSDLPPRQRDAAVAELVKRGLWEEIGAGYEIHDYLDYNPSRKKVEEERDAASARQARWRDSKRRRDDRNGAVDASTARHGRRVTNGAVTLPRTRPVPLPDPSNARGGTQPNSRLRAV